MESYSDSPMPKNWPKRKKKCQAGKTKKCRGRKNKEITGSNIGGILGAAATGFAGWKAYQKMKEN